ncbi:MAG TPA: hypothetical protein VF950_01795 [Planctomycetota bacterium]
MPTFNAHGMDVPPDVRREFRRRITLDGLRLKVELLGALWIKAPFYGIMVSTPDHQHASYVIQRPYARCGAKDYEKLLERVHTAPCSRPRCGRRCLADDPSNPDALCRPHWAAQLKKDVARELKESSERLAREDARARKRGARYRAVLWLHRGGDDVYIVRYFKKKPEDVELRRIAARKKSKILDDFSVARL